MQPPSSGWTAFFIELTFPSGGKYPFKETTAIRVLPETLPFAAPNAQPVATPAAREKPAAERRPTLSND